MRRLAPAAGILALALGGAGTVVGHREKAVPPQALAASGRSVVVIRSQLPTWLAPGGRLSVAGFAGSRVRVVLRLNGRAVAAVRSGQLGRFDFHLRAPGAGRYQVTARVGDEVRPIGRLTVRPLELAAVGDVTPGEQVGPTVLAIGAGYPWGSVGPLLNAADLTTANLEGVVSSRGTAAPSKKYRFRGPQALLTGARTYAGMDVLTLANNHVMDYGAVGLRDTLIAAARAGIETVGAGVSARAAHRPAVVEAGGLRVAFLGYSDVNPIGFVASDATAGTAQARAETIAADVRSARRSADLVVCWFHWGTELRSSPDVRQRAFAAAALAAGAKVVLGAHPHVLGQVARPTPTTLVAWTLGNFVFPNGSPATAPTGILLVRLGARGVLQSRVAPALSGVRPSLR